ncbi:polysaccharide deacetylase family protein [Colwellia sp. KU-HH00111]|uniref:polysaccharide deacetylase family protein n=1 Tax=Colwellia sp. KU-HH00111 TaxID=3127652 RepID=UPI003109DD77
MFDKQKLKSMLIRFSGYEAYKWLTRKNGLYCFNYHRIGDSSLSPFDPNIYSCTAENFEKQLQFIKKQFTVVTLDEAISLTQNDMPLNKRYALITFDDGYIDNYEIAYPILQEQQVSAVFFIPTDYIGTDIIPWWDEIAWMLKNTKKESFIFGGTNEFRLSNEPIARVIQRCLASVKFDPRTMDEKLHELKTELACEYLANYKDQSLFMTWEQLRELKAGGMFIGSHTCSHRILTHIDEKERLFELQSSKSCLENNLNCRVDAIAYPVGENNTFNHAVCEMSKNIGYKIGFSFTNSINDTPIKNPFEISRLGIDNHPGMMSLRQKIVMQ